MIFISYRREGGTIYADLLEEKLSAHFGKDKIFIDRGSIEIGEDFERKISDALSTCEVLLAIIGRTWLSSSQTERAPRWSPSNRRKARRRIDDPKDYVRQEIATALERDIKVIPILVEGANMPKPEHLPENLKALSHCNGVILSELHWKSGIAQLIPELQRVVDEAPEARRRRQLDAEESQRQEESKRKAAAEAERIRRNAEVREQELRFKAITLRLTNLALRVILVICIVAIYKVIPQKAKDYVWQLAGRLTSATPTPTPIRPPQFLNKSGSIDYSGILKPKSDILKPKPSPQPSPTFPPFMKRFEMTFTWVSRGDSGFYVAGVTNAEWKKVTGKYLYSQYLPNVPVGEIPQHDAEQFIDKLNHIDNEYLYSLPTKDEKESLPSGFRVVARPRNRLWSN